MGSASKPFYRWKVKYGGMGPSEAQRLKGLEDENRRLKKLLAEAMLDAAARKDMLAENQARLQAGRPSLARSKNLLLPPRRPGARMRQVSVSAGSPPPPLGELCITWGSMIR
jgi:Transposase